MTVMSETVVFFGSGPVAAQSLELLAQNFTVEAVITKPQPAHHKAVFPVLAVAEKLGLTTLTPSNKLELSELFANKPVTSTIGVVIDYGIIINQDVIDYFPRGIVNSHFSLLPKWRGADPISFAILNGDKQTGVSLMLIVAALDEGPLLAQAPFDITDGMITPDLTESLIEISDQSLQHILPLYLSGQTVAQEQSTDQPATYSRKLSKADGQLDFQKPAAKLEREVRAFIEWPKCRTIIGDKEVIITKAHPQIGSGKVGKIWREAKQFGFYTIEGIFVIDKLKPAGKAEMTAEAFLAGYGKNLI
jgi:methionyl-tRNA formyltransferase